MVWPDAYQNRGATHYFSNIELLFFKSAASEMLSFVNNSADSAFSKSESADGITSLYTRLTDTHAYPVLLKLSYSAIKEYGLI